MSNTQSITGRIVKALLRQPRKDRLIGFNLAHYSPMSRFLSAKAEGGEEERSQNSFGKEGIFAMIAIGGLGFSLIDSLKYQANCAEEDDDVIDECGIKCVDPSCIRKMEKEEKIIEKANNDLVKDLGNLKPKAMEATEAALKAYREASLVLKEFMDAAYCAIEEDGMQTPEFEETWCGVYNLAVDRCEKVKDAIEKGQCAWELLCKLREIIVNGKACVYTSCHPLLITGEDFVNCAERELLNARALMECVQSDSRLVEVYRALIETFRQQLKAELESVTECNLTDDECAKILSRAYKKVMDVQKELALLQVGLAKVPDKQSQTLC